MENIYSHGLAPDPRPVEKKLTDILHEKVAGDVFIEWKEKLQSEWKKYTPREQDGSLSCCAQSAAKAIEILNGTIESAHPIYRSRINFPAGGMYLQNLGDCCKKIGTTLESLDASQFENETTMNRDITVLTPTKIGGYVFVNPKNIDEIAQAIELNKHCMLLVHANHAEWTATPVFNGANIDFGHCVCATDYFLHNGTKMILIEDSTSHSTSLDSTGLRLITENYLKARFEGGMYFTLESPIPQHTFFKFLKQGMRDPEVKFLQEKLGVIQTGYFGTLTATAVKKFQLEHGLIPDALVGSETNRALNK